MEKKQVQGLKRLAPKLSALRKTLRGEERHILDEMVKAYQSEVALHGANVGQKSGSKTTTKISEVSLHSASVGQKSASKTPSVDSQKSVSRASIDLQAGIYRVTIL